MLSAYSPHFSNPPHRTLPQGDSLNNLLRRVDLVSGLVTTLAGSPTQVTGNADGMGTLATFANLAGIA